jgi:3-phenylpropionate/trans-cinnamate dioxygenase ferredoxin reductase component
LAAQAGLEIGDRGGVRVDSTLRTSDPAIFAAGDIALFPDAALGKEWHVEHFLSARWQGRAVGATMAGEATPYTRVAYFYSDSLDLHMIHRGDAGPGGDRVLLGDLASGEFVELSHNGSGAITGGLAMSHNEPTLDPIADKLEELIAAKAPIASVSASTFGL